MKLEWIYNYEKMILSKSLFILRKYNDNCNINSFDVDNLYKYKNIIYVIKYNDLVFLYIKIKKQKNLIIFILIVLIILIFILSVIIKINIVIIIKYK